MDKVDIKCMDLGQLENFIKDLELPKFRAKQIFDWMYKGKSEFKDMKNLGQDIINLLDSVAYIGKIKIAKKFESELDDTIKYLFELEDGNIIESVLMKYNYGYSACISSQVGCKMSCSFCASTKGGFIRNLTAGEMVDQILQINVDTGIRISHVVVMGSGEPFDNYEQLTKFINLANSEPGLNIGMRKITVSTCGVIDKIYDFADKFTQVNLSISLHASNDRLRQTIMPSGKKYIIGEIVKACKYYTTNTKRRITFEYLLIKGVNSDKDNAIELANLLRNMLCHVNLIPVNKITEKNYDRPSSREVKAFKDILESANISATVRRELGSDINAACGQLRRNFIAE